MILIFDEKVRLRKKTEKEMLVYVHENKTTRFIMVVRKMTTYR